MRNHSTVSSKKIDSTWHKTLKNSPAQSGKSQTMSSGDHAISDLGYCRTLRHHFDGGDPVEDWLMMEEEVDFMLYGGKENGS